MVFFNWATMQMAAKIVYYGPGLCGKTSNLSYIYARTSPGSRGEMVSLETESDRTLFFDLLPIEVGTIGGFKTRLQLYTVPGQVFYNTTRKLVLKGVDGLVFVADSQRPMREANVESLSSLVDNLKELGLEMGDLPLVLQFNKRDLKNTLTVDELNADLNPEGIFPHFESSAINGEGVFETLKEITKLTLKKLRKRMTAPQAGVGGPRLGGPSVRPVQPPRPATSISAASLARAAEEGVDDTSPEQVDGTSPEQIEDAPSRPTPYGSPQGMESEVAETAGPGADGESSDVDVEAQAEGAAEPIETDSPDAEAVEAIEDGDGAPFEIDGGSDGDQLDLPTGEEIGEPFTEIEIAGRDPEATSEDPDLETAAESDVDLEVEFDQSDTAVDDAEPPPVKRVQLSNQMDILAELDGLRKQATMAGISRNFKSTTPDLDLDSLLAGEAGRTKELRRTIQKSLNSDLFENMRGLQVAIRIQDKNGETIHSLDPVSLHVENAKDLDRLCLRFSVDLENIP